MKSIAIVKSLVDFMESLALLPFQGKNSAWSSGLVNMLDLIIICLFLFWVGRCFLGRRRGVSVGSVILIVEGLLMP